MLKSGLPRFIYYYSYHSDRQQGNGRSPRPTYTEKRRNELFIIFISQLSTLRRADSISFAEGYSIQGPEF
jgi:hypothetical protein